MLIQFIIFFLLLTAIYFLAPHINTAIYRLALLLTRSKKISLGILIVFLLPGTIIHELSHFIIAAVLFVPTGELTVFPKVEEGEIKAGSLHHADSDPIRRSLIGIAPMIIGISMIYIIGSLLFPQITNSQLPITNEFFKSQFSIYLFLVSCYLLFITSISMFSSRKDLEVAGIFIPFIFIIILVLYFNGLRLSFSTDLNQAVTHFFTRLNSYLEITLGLDLTIIVILNSLILFLQKLLKIKIVRRS